MNENRQKEHRTLKNILYIKRCKNNFFHPLFYQFLIFYEKIKIKIYKKFLRGCFHLK